MKIYKYIIAIATIGLAAGCSSTEEMEVAANGRVQITATLPSPKADTRVTLAGDAFAEGDQITLYYGDPKETAVKGTYTYDGSTTWSGSGLYWDNCEKRHATDNKFVGIANNAILTLSAPSATCAVKNNQSTDANYIASDLLVAYAISAEFTTVELTFNHAFAHFVINITDQTLGSTPAILNESTIVKVNGIKVNSNINFDLINSETDVAVTGDTASITTRKKTFSNKSYSYELILPAQSLATDVTLSIESKINGKTYTYDLSGTEIKDVNSSLLDKATMLAQGKTTTLNLTITKTDIGTISATLTGWTNTSADTETTPEDYPILEIGTVDDLKNILSKGEDFAGKTIKLTDDINASTLILPIGQCPTPFRGIFDGQGYTISNVKLDAATPTFMGLFGCTEGATIMNLNVKDVNINNKSQSSSTATGALIGYAVDTKVLNCHVKQASVEATYDNVGGLIGYADGCVIELSSSASTVTGHHNYAGGLIGEALLTTISNSYATGDATLCKAGNTSTPTGYYAGGLVGHFYGIKLTNCYAWGNVSCKSYAGGLLGACGNISLKSCYAAGTVSPTIGGGFIGISEQLKLTNVNYCYWNAKATGADNTQSDGVNTGTMITNDRNISFVLTETPVSMEPVVEGLNQTDQAWELGTGALNQLSTTKTYALPLLLKNTGSATRANLVVIDKTESK